MKQNFQDPMKQRCYDRAIPLRCGWVVETDEAQWRCLVQWDDGEEGWRDLDSLGHVPPEHVEETLS